MPTPTLHRYTVVHDHENADCPCIDAGTAATCPGTCHYQNDLAAQRLVDEDRPDAMTWVIVLGTLFFLEIVVPAWSAGLVIR